MRRKQYAEIPVHDMEQQHRHFPDPPRKQRRVSNTGLARELAKALGYEDYRNFLKVVQKGRMACENTRASGRGSFR